MRAQEKIYYNRNLPHLQPPGGTFFVTFRLKGSIPMAALRKLLDEQALARVDFARSTPTPAETASFYLRQAYAYDELLDRIQHGPTHLRRPPIAKMLERKLWEFDGAFYDLLSYCIMPNHVHLLIDTHLQLGPDGKVPEDYVQLHEIMRRIKGATALNANRLLKRKGGFWQAESYDHWVRNGDSLLRIVAYIMENPVKAGLVKTWRDWAFAYAKGFSEDRKG